jgi:hypothetical protein
MKSVLNPRVSQNVSHRCHLYPMLAGRRSCGRPDFGRPTAEKAVADAFARIKL